MSAAVAMLAEMKREQQKKIDEFFDQFLIDLVTKSDGRLKLIVPAMPKAKARK